VAFRAIQSNPFFERSLIHSYGSYMIKKEKVTAQFLRKWTPSSKRVKLDLLTLEKIP
jgi:hypothetical protein